MTLVFEELDYQETPKGVLSLRRRSLPGTDTIVHEIKLDDEFLMSDLFTAAEEELARLGLAAVEGEDLDVVVGGLGLGYTALAALTDDRVAELLVVDALPAVIGWHREGLLPLGRALTGDPRCRFVEGDFFTMADDPATGFDPDRPGRRFDAVLLDVDHSPSNLLVPEHGALYTAEGLSRLAEHIKPGGAFALWSNDPPEERFLKAMDAAFPGAWADIVTFPAPVGDGEATNTVYVGQKAKDA